MLSKLKLFLGLSSDKDDEYLTLLLDISKQEILNYCNLWELPKELELVWVIMAADLYNELQDKKHVSDSQEEGVGAVSSIKEGDRTVSFETSNASKTVSQIQRATGEYVSKLTQLNRFRLPYRYPEVQDGV